METRERDLAMADRTATLVRAAFDRGDRFPGLPAADGTAETAGAVLTDLARGVRLWTSFDEQGSPLGCVRAVPNGDAEWAVRRLAVHPGSRGRRIGWRLLRALEDQARAEGVRRVVLDAVVERGNPPFYCGLGYRTTSHFPGPDKPLSEVGMVKELGVPEEPLAYPWGGEPRPLWSDEVLAWFAGPDGTAAVAGSLGTDPIAALGGLAELAGSDVGPARFLGADGLRGADGEHTPRLRRLAAGTADRMRGEVAVYDRAAADVPAFLMPRVVEPEALALWRMLGA